MWYELAATVWRVLNVGSLAGRYLFKGGVVDNAS